MQRALTLATYAIKACRPNPAVGAVVVKNGIVVGEGYTQAPGGDHAEKVALKNAGENAAGADLYVTLEPCCHFGRTPPCTDAIIKARIKKVYYGCLDVNPEVSGKGIEALKNAGVEVEQQNLSYDFYESYAYFVKHKKPFVTVKIAQTMNGFIAKADRSPLKITGDESQVELHRLRSFCDAVVVGGGTFRADNPQLNVRLVDGASPEKFIFTRKYSWGEVMENFAERGMHHILVEAGATLLEHIPFFNRFLLWTSPLRINEGLKWKMPQDLNLRLEKTYMQGGDLVLKFTHR